MAEDMETSERFKRAYKIGRECGECVREFDYDPGKDTKTAMYDYEWRVGCDYDDTPQSMSIDNDPALIDKWEDGFIDGYEQRHKDEKAD